MIKSPIIILLELLRGLIASLIESLKFTVLKLFELFVSLGLISGLGLMEFIIAVIFGSIVLFLILRFIFGLSKSLSILFIIFVILLILVALSISAQIPITLTNSTNL